jgi:glycosyltransferase involved in cell wall biosynthesis
VFPQKNTDSNLYSDLIDEIASRGHDVIVINPDESRWKGNPIVYSRRSSQIVSVPTGKITKTHIINKALNTMLIDFRYTKALKPIIHGKNVDLVMYSTPPITFINAIKLLKRRGAHTYLLLKDIFPQNAVDLGIFRKDGFLHLYFKKKEKALYRISERIGCMSKANHSYILAHNTWLEPEKVEINPNSIVPLLISPLQLPENRIRHSLGIPEEKVLFVYGGNIGKPQGVDFILQVITALKAITDIFILIIGNGTEFCKIQALAESISKDSIKVLPFLEKEQYQKLLLVADVGMIFLDKRFTIPNFPSRVLDYFNFSLPVLAATDSNTDFGFMLTSNNAGLWSKSGDLPGFLQNVEYFRINRFEREKMGMNGRKILETYFNVNRSADLILDFLYHIKTLEKFKSEGE